MQNNNIDITSSVMGLEELGTLKRFEVKIPTFEKLDKELSVHVSNGVNGNQDVFSVRKQLIDKELIKSMKNRVRRFRLDISEWMIPHEGQWHFVLNQHAELVEKEWDAFKSDMVDGFLNPFVKNYQKAIEDQRVELGNAFNEDDYPPVDDLLDRPLTQEEKESLQYNYGKMKIFYVGDEPWKQGLFHLYDHVSAIPTVDLDRTVFTDEVSHRDFYSRRNNPNHAQLFAKIRQQQVQREEQFKSKVINDTVTALTESIESAVDSLAKYDATNKKASPFRNTLVANLQKTISIAEDRNNAFVNSEDIANAISIAKDSLEGITTESLREDNELREDTAKKLSKSKSLLGV